MVDKGLTRTSWSMMIMAMHDLELLDRWYAENDAEAFQELAARHAGMVYATCLRVLGNGPDAEDVAQECFEALCHGRRRPRANLPAWLHRLAANRAIDRIRSEKRRAARETRYSEARDTSVESGWDDVRAEVDRALAELPERLRTPLVAHFLEGKTHAAIAAELRTTRQNVTYRIRKGVAALRTRLRRRGIAVPAAALAALLGEHMAEAAVPASLSASLGKLAMAGVRSPGTSMTVPLKGLAAALAVAVVVMGTLFGLRGADRRMPGAVGPVPVDARPSAHAPAPAPLVADAEPASEAEQPAIGSAVSVVSPEGGCTIRGRVVDAGTREPVGGVLARMRHMGKAHNTRDVPVNDEGVFEFTGLEPGRCEILLIADGKDGGWADTPYLTPEPQRVVLGEEAGKTEVTFSLERGLLITGRVVDPTGRPVGGAKVSAMSEVPRMHHEFLENGSEGRFALRYHPQAVQLRVDARADEMRMLPREPVSVAEGTPAPQEIVLVDVGEAQGQVLTFEGEPAPDLLVRVVSKTLLHEASRPLLNKNSYREDLTRDEGAFRVDGIPAGTYEVTAATGPSYSDTLKLGQLELGPREKLEGLVYHLPRGFEIPTRTEPEAPYRITGRVVDTRGKGVPGARGNVHAQHRTVGFFAADEEGGFSVALTHEPPYTLAFQGARGLAFQVVKGVRDGQHVHVVLEDLVTLRGRVLDAHTGKPVERFEVTALQMPAQGGNPWLKRVLTMPVTPTHYRAGELRAGGAFVLDEVHPDARWLRVFAPGYPPAGVPIHARFQKGDIEVRLQPGAALRGTVQDPGGAPVPNARIFLSSVFEGTALSRIDTERLAEEEPRAITDEDGAFEYEGLGNGEILLVAWHPSWIPHHQFLHVASAGDQNVRITLARPANLSVQVLYGGATLQTGGLAAEWGPPVSDEGGLLYDLMAKGNAEGIYRFEGVPPEGVRIRGRLYKDSSQHCYFTTDVRPQADGGTLVVDIPPGTGSVTVDAGSLDLAAAEGLYCILRLDTAWGTAEIRTGAEGRRCALHSVPAGSGTISVSAVTPDTTEYHEEFPVRIDPGEALVVRLGEQASPTPLLPPALPGNPRRCSEAGYWPPGPRTRGPTGARPLCRGPSRWPGRGVPVPRAPG